MKRLLVLALAGASLAGCSAQIIEQAQIDEAPPGVVFMTSALAAMTVALATGIFEDN